MAKGNHPLAAGLLLLGGLGACAEILGVDEYRTHAPPAESGSLGIPFASKLAGMRRRSVRRGAS
jgi:hypothetical protein